MSKLLRTMVGVVAFVLVVGGVSANGTQKAQAVGGTQGIISGWVYDEGTNNPLGGMNVYLKRRSDPLGDYAAFTTSRVDGSFTFYLMCSSVGEDYWVNAEEPDDYSYNGSSDRFTVKAPDDCLYAGVEVPVANHH